MSIPSVIWRALINEVRCLLRWLSFLSATRIVETEHGPVRGRKRADTTAFLGIPYAGSVAGEARWKAPQRPQAWTSPRDCLHAGPCAPQDLAGLASTTHSLVYMIAVVLLRYAKGFIRTPQIYKGSEEECLNLNVWTPTDEANAKLPVMVFIHGGAFFLGSGGPPLYSGENFSKEAVLVSVNYRLGLLGFLNVPGCDANRGLRDQLFALEWVRNNIANFGGDPTNVTIFGESAGGMSCANLMASPLRIYQGKPLFTKAICMSGATQCVHSQEQAKQVYTECLELLPNGVDTTLSDLSTLPYSVLHKAQQRYIKTHIKAFDSGNRADLIRIGPHVDDSVLPTHPSTVISNGTASDVSLLAGTTEHEYSLFTSFTRGKEDLDSILPTVLDAMLQGAGTKAEEVVSHYAESDYVTAFSGLDNHRVFNAVMTDLVFRIPCERLAHLHAAAGGQARVYRWEEPAAARSLGAAHGSELAPLFGTHFGIPLLSGCKTTTCNAGLSLRDIFVKFAANQPLAFEGWEQFSADNRSVLTVGGKNCAKIQNNPDCLGIWGDLAQYDFVNP